MRLTIRYRVLWITCVGLLAACSLSASDQHQTATAPPISKPGEQLMVAWVENGNLMTWRRDDPLPRRIASGGVIQPFLSPDGNWVAYLRGPGGNTRSLWLSDTPGAGERQLIDAAALVAGDTVRRLKQVVWAADSSALYFNTLTGEGISTHSVDDLWRVDRQTGTIELLLPDGNGGQAFPDPDRKVLALAAAGEYQGKPGTVVFYAPSTRERTIALEFPAVATASEQPWYPRPRWLPDGSGMLVAIPPPDLVYGAGETSTTLWRLSPGSDPVRVGQVEADFFGLPAFSPDGMWIAYIQRRSVPDQTDLTLMIAKIDGSESSAYAQGKIGALGLPGWLPGGTRFVFAQGKPGEYWIGQPDMAPDAFPATVADWLWLDTNTVVFSSGTEGTFTLNVGQMDESPPRLETIASISVYPFFDAVSP